MKKAILASILLVLCSNAFSGQVGLPTELIEFPELQGNYLVCVWDETAGTWLWAHASYDLSGSYRFQLPEWGSWYWVGLWDTASGGYVYEKWIGHFLTD